MRRRLSCSISIILACAMVFLLAGCSEGGSAADDSTGSRETRTSFLAPEASGTEVYSSDIASIDASNSSEGYIMVKYSGNAGKIKIQITGADGITYTYTSHKGDYETFPLSVGSGNYRIDVLENVQSNLVRSFGIYSFALVCITCDFLYCRKFTPVSNGDGQFYRGI